MAKGRIGLDIGSTAVRAVELTGKDPYTVVHAAQVALPSAAVENGEVRDPGVVAEALRELWQRGGFKQKRVYMGVGNQRVVVEVRVPRVQSEDGRAAVERLSENLDERSYREDEGFFDRLKHAFR